MTLDESVEETLDFQLKPGARGVIPVALMEYGTGTYLFSASQTMETFRETMQGGYVVLWSETRNERWPKGETSGDYLKVERVYVNCEQDSLLYEVSLVGNGACHTGRVSCNYREIRMENGIPTLRWRK